MDFKIPTMHMWSAINLKSSKLCLIVQFSFGFLFWAYIYIYIYIFCVCTKDEGVKVEGELGPPSSLTHFDPLMQI